MVWSKHAARDRAAWELVRRQHGVVTRVGLLELGFGHRSIEHRVRSVCLHLISPGVYWQVAHAHEVTDVFRQVRAIP